MRKTLNIDDDLLRSAKEAAHVKTDTEAVKLGLEALVRQEAYRRALAFRGSEPDALDVPRRRP